jgi:hypothetical protein
VKAKAELKLPAEKCTQDTEKAIWQELVHTEIQGI